MEPKRKYPPGIGEISVIEAPPDLIDLLIAVRTINREILSKELSSLEQLSVRFVVSELLDVSLELVAGKDEEISAFTRHGLFDDVPF